MKAFFHKRSSMTVAAAALILLLLAKYFWSFFAFPGVPFGYDAGIYRYLFLKHAHAFPPFLVTTLPPWAAAHPLGLFFFSTLLLDLGVPVDSLIGWVWNLFPVVLSIVFASVLSRRHGTQFGLLLLLVCVLSTVQLQGFLMIYWKVFVALLWSVLAFDAFERNSRVWIVFGMMVIATHQQIGLIFVLAVLGATFCGDRKHLLQALSRWLLSCVLGALWYLPNAERAIGDILPLLFGSFVLRLALLIAGLGIGVFFIVRAVPKHLYILLWMLCFLFVTVGVLVPLTGHAPAALSHLLDRSMDTNGGSFFTMREYLQRSLPLLLLGCIGFFSSLRRERGSVWQFAVMVCVLAVVTHAFFYRRFLLPLDFYLLPCAAWGIRELWDRRLWATRLLVLVLIVAQGYLLFQHIRSLDPHVEPAMLAFFAELPSTVEPSAQVIVLDTMAPWVVGYLLDAEVSGPGIFDSQPLEAWQTFLYGSHADRELFIKHYPLGTYFFASDVFRAYYPPQVQTLLTDPCLLPTTMTGLFRSACSASASI